MRLPHLCCRGRCRGCAPSGSVVLSMWRRSPGPVAVLSASVVPAGAVPTGSERLIGRFTQYSSESPPILRPMSAYLRPCAFAISLDSALDMISFAAPAVKRWRRIFTARVSPATVRWTSLQNTMRAVLAPVS